MSDMAAAFAEAQAEVAGGIETAPEAPAVDGEVVGEEAEPEAPVADTPEVQSDAPDGEVGFDGPPLLDVDEFGDYVVTVKVDGEEQQVPVREALSGYMRQADYTRKTQQIAADRQDIQFAQALRQGLERDPLGTLQALAQHYGLVGQQAEQPQFDDPLEARIYELEQALTAKVSQLESFYGQTLLDREIDRLSNTYADFADHLDDVIATAATRDVSLEDAYKIVTYDNRLTAAQNAEKRAQQAAAAREAKRKSQIVSSGKSSVGKPPMSDEPEDDSLEATLRWAISNRGRR